MPNPGPSEKPRVSYLTVSQEFNLRHACRMVEAAFGGCSYGTYHVGSSLERANWRDVDVRCILEDEAFVRFFGAGDTRLKFLNVAISDWLMSRTGLPVDFQFQAQSKANAEFKGRPRNFVAPPLEELGGD